MGRKIITVDISDFEQRKQEIAAQLLEASKDVGFFYIGGAHPCRCGPCKRMAAVYCRTVDRRILTGRSCGRCFTTMLLPNIILEQMFCIGCDRAVNVVGHP